MNVNDSQIAAKVLSNYNYQVVDKLKNNDVDIILVMQRIYHIVFDDHHDDQIATVY